MSKKDGYVLILEDENADFEKMKEFLKKKGYTAKQAISAVEAFKLAESSKPNVIMANLINGEKGIFTGLQACRQISENLDVPVVCYSPLEGDVPFIGKNKKITGNVFVDGIVPKNAAEIHGAKEYLENPLGKGNMSSMLDSIKKYF